MKNIYKYELPPKQGVYKIEVPEGANLLSCQQQGNNRVSFWFMVNKENKPVVKQFALILTGIDIEYKSFELKYISTCQFDNGAFVLHLFEILI